MRDRIKLSRDSRDLRRVSVWDEDYADYVPRKARRRTTFVD